MYKLLTFLVVSVMWCSVVFAQVNTGSLTARGEADWEKMNIDTTTEGGKWLTNTYKPYLWELLKAMERFITQIKFDNTVSAEEIQSKTKQAQSEYYNSIQNITPPPELKEYHSKMLQMIAENIKSTSINEALEDRLIKETSLELERVFREHGVPQNIIEELNKSRK